MFPIAVAISFSRETALISAHPLFSHSTFCKGFQSHQCPFEPNLGYNSVSESIVFGMFQLVTRFSSL